MARERELPSARVDRELRARLESGEWDHGQKLPSVSELADHYGVSRATMVKVLGRLAADGLVEVVPSWGTFRC